MRPVANTTGPLVSLTVVMSDPTSSETVLIFLEYPHCLMRTLYILDLGTSDDRGAVMRCLSKHSRCHEMIIPGHDVHDLFQLFPLVDVEMFDDWPMPAPIIDAGATTACRAQRHRRTGHGCSCHCARGGRTQCIRRVLVRLPRSRSGPSDCSNLVSQARGGRLMTRRRTSKPAEPLR